MFFGQDSSLALPKGEGLSASDLNLSQEKEEYADDKDHREPGKENILPERSIFFLLCDNHNMLLPEESNHFRVFRCIGLIAFAIYISPNEISPFRLYFHNAILLYRRDEIRIILIPYRLVRFIEEIEKEDHDQDDHSPKG